MGEVILTMKGIDKSFPGVHALDHVDLEVRKGEVLALMGENGAGKSTLMKVLTGIYKKDSGTITYEGSMSICILSNSFFASSFIFLSSMRIPFLNSLPMKMF